MHTKYVEYSKNLVGGLCVRMRRLIVVLKKRSGGGGGEGVPGLMCVGCRGTERFVIGVSVDVQA